MSDPRLVVIVLNLVIATGLIVRAAMFWMARKRGSTVPAKIVATEHRGVGARGAYDVVKIRYTDVAGGTHNLEKKVTWWNLIGANNIFVIMRIDDNSRGRAYNPKFEALLNRSYLCLLAASIVALSYSTVVSYFVGAR